MEKEAKKGVVAMHKFVTTVDGYSVEMLVRDKGDKQYLYEVKFIKTKKDPQQSMADKSAFPAPEGDVEDGEIIPQIEESVNSKFSISEEKSFDIRYSIDETPETPDVSENRDLTVSFCSDRESKWLIWNRQLKIIFRFRKIIFRNLLTNPPTWCIMMPMKEKTASAMDDPMED